MSSRGKFLPEDGKSPNRRTVRASSSRLTPHSTKPPSSLIPIAAAQQARWATQWTSTPPRIRIKLVLPLFPSCLFVHISPGERNKVLRSPGVLQIMGPKSSYLPLANEEIDWLRSRVYRQRIEPYRDLAIGDKVRIKSVVMQWTAPLS